MKIGDRDFSEIIFTDGDDHVLAVVSDTEIVEGDGVKVVCVPCDDLS